jgi:hypothetical protein
MDITEDLNNINNFIKYLSLVSSTTTNKATTNNKITIQEYNIIKKLSKIATDFFNLDDNDSISENDVDFIDNDNNINIESNEVKPKDNFLLKIQNNELSKEQLLSHNQDLDRKYIIFNLKCLNN